MRHLSIDWLAYQLTPAPAGVGRPWVRCDVRNTFAKSTITAARRRGYRVEQVGNWTYIVHAKNGDQNGKT